MLPEGKVEKVEALKSAGRLSLLGMKHPERWPEWIVEFGIWLNKPFGVSREYKSFHPWESVERHFTSVPYKDLYFGAAYRCVGEA